MKVQFSLRARNRVRLVATWWRANRPDAPDLFEDELGAATAQLATPPTLGLIYANIRGSVIRRVLLPRTAQHVYFSIDEDVPVVIIHTVWGARRGRGPKL